MKITQRQHPAGFPVFEVSYFGNEVVISAFGAQLLQWRKNGVDILFSNRSHAVDDGVTPYRGGAPICFPYFGRGTLLPLGTTLNPQHGVARKSVWEPEVGPHNLTFRLSQPAPDGYGPSELACKITYWFADDLWIQIGVTNEGETATPFQLAVHSYWACARPEDVTVQGLGMRYLDNLRGFELDMDPAHDAPHTPVFDRIYLLPDDVMTVTTESYALDITAKGCHGAVLWNPGKEHTIADLGEPNFICVESGVISPSVKVAPGETHRSTIAYRAELRS